MTDPGATKLRATSDGPTHPRPTNLDGGSRVLSPALNIAGVAIVAVLVARDPFASHPLWIWAITGIALLGWLVHELLPARVERLQLVVLSVTVVVSSLVAIPTEVLGFVPGLVCLAVLIASPARPLWIGLLATLVSAALLPVAGFPYFSEQGLVLGAYAPLVIATLVGVSRRQYRSAIVRQRELLEERLHLQEESTRAAALGERGRIARDIHDVLAHSLGGLVLQLDAIDALLDSGEVDQAHARVTAARGLAASGLDEARRAVDTLRDPDDAIDVDAALADLLATHRSLGCEATLAIVRTGPEVALPPAVAGALRRAAQEALSNARRHAPGQPTSLSLTQSAELVTLEASTPQTPGPTPASGHGSTPGGGGRGLLGLRERVTALGGTAEWAVRDGVFVVTASLPLGTTS